MSHCSYVQAILCIYAYLFFIVVIDVIDGGAVQSVLFGLVSEVCGPTK